MSTPKDGGQAFPLPFHQDNDGSREWSLQAGMSLRAYFAGQAMLMFGETWRELPKGEDCAVVAELSVQMADALIAELNKNNT